MSTTEYVQDFNEMVEVAKTMIPLMRDMDGITKLLLLRLVLRYNDKTIKFDRLFSF